MNATTAQRINKLLAIKTENYRARGEYDPVAAAQFAVHDILNMYKTQMDGIDQLLDWEIEDAIKAGAELAGE